MAADPRADPQADPSMLIDLARMRMPFGRYQGRRLVDLPEPYVVWFHQRGMPRGRLGALLGLLYEVKVNGLEHLVRKAAASATGPGDAGEPRRPVRTAPPRPRRER